jgi:hypothetical protein
MIGMVDLKFKKEECIEYSSSLFLLLLRPYHQYKNIWTI